MPKKLFCGKRKIVNKRQGIYIQSFFKNILESFVWNIFVGFKKFPNDQDPGVQFLKTECIDIFQQIIYMNITVKP